MRAEPPMPALTVLEVKFREGAPVARVSFFDVTDDQRQLDLSPRVAATLLTQLAQFLEHHPGAWR